MSRDICHHCPPGFVTNAFKQHANFWRKIQAEQQSKTVNKYMNALGGRSYKVLHTSTLNTI